MHEVTIGGPSLTKPSGPVSDQSNDPTIRDPINNIWDEDTFFQFTKTAVKSDSSSHKIQATAEFGRRLLLTVDPYLVKFGIQLFRISLWHNADFARAWVMDTAPNLAFNPHPRVRHSNLWNIRTSVWMDPSLASVVLPICYKALKDEDAAVRRVAIWVLGDCVANDPTLFSEVMSVVSEYLQTTTKESTLLFALEEFFLPNRLRFGAHSDFRTALQRMQRSAVGLPGVQARAASILGVPIAINQIDRQLILDRISGRDVVSKELLESRDLGAMVDVTIERLFDSVGFISRMNTIWAVRDLLWVEPDLAERLFLPLATLIAGTRDGDLFRTISFVLGDCVLLAPTQLMEHACNTVLDLYSHQDNDGTQIIIAQILWPARHRILADIVKSERMMSNILPAMLRNAINLSVTHTLKNLFM